MKAIMYCCVTIILAICLLVFFSSCCSIEPSASVTSKYTDQIALAIIAAGWKIAGAIVIAAIIRAVFNK